MPNTNFDDFTTRIQSDEIGAKNGCDWVNDFDDDDYEEFVDD